MEVFGGGLDWLHFARQRGSEVLQQYGLLLVLLLVAAVYLGPSLKRKIVDMLGGGPLFAAQGIANIDIVSSGAAVSDRYAEHRRAAIYRLQAKLQEETQRALLQQQHNQQSVQARHLEEEAHRLGMSHKLDRGETVGDNSEAHENRPREGPSPSAAQRKTSTNQTPNLRQLSPPSSWLWVCDKMLQRHVFHKDGFSFSPAFLSSYPFPRPPSFPFNHRW